MIKYTAALALLLTLPLLYQSHQDLISIRKDYECEIREKDFFIKDCYRNVELNLEDQKMIAFMQNSFHESD